VSRAPEPCQRPRSTTREDAALRLLDAGPADLDALAALLPASVGAGSKDPRHRRREAARVVADGLRLDGRAVLGEDGRYRRVSR
jgi:hypothetical protein